MVFGGQKFQFTAQDLAHTAAFDTLPLRRQWNREGDDGSSVGWTKLAQLKTNINAQAKWGAKVGTFRNGNWWRILTNSKRSRFAVFVFQQEFLLIQQK